MVRPPRRHARITGGDAPSPPSGGSAKRGGESFCLSAPQGTGSLRSKLYCVIVIVYSLKIPKGALLQTSFACAASRKRQKDSPRPLARSAPKGQRQGRENFPRSQRRDDQMPEQAKRARPGKARHEVGSLARMSGVGRREAGAARGKFPLVKWSEKKK